MPAAGSWEPVGRAPRMFENLWPTKFLNLWFICRIIASADIQSGPFTKSLAVSAVAPLVKSDRVCLGFISASLGFSPSWLRFSRLPCLEVWSSVTLLLCMISLDSDSPSPGDYQWHLYLIREGMEIVPLPTIVLYFQLSTGYLETEPIIFFIGQIDFSRRLCWQLFILVACVGGESSLKLNFC